MSVRALYDYVADDETSLSFRQGDIIHVINQLESGWWDGMINNVRGWFPSNYCAVIAGSGENGEGGQTPSVGDEESAESETDGEYNNYERAQINWDQRNGSSASAERSEGQQQEEAAFWIPQATSDGRLYYFNTMTGVSTMELPLETPTSANETGPHDRMNIRAPDQTRPPPEMMASGVVRDEDEEAASASEAEELMNASRGSLPRRRRSYISDGASPTASMSSVNASPVTRTRNGSQEFSSQLRAPASRPPMGTPATSFTGNLLGQFPNSAVPRSFFDDGTTPPVTWNRLVENMRKSVESYGQAINNADRSEYVRKAEDISDHLRMLLAAGSGTTDNHSGNPSVISTNKALYPHFRDMMSRFSKLVLSSHIAAADFPAPDAYSKCLQEAEGVMNGVYGYVEVARTQRGEEIPRLIPGFVLGSNTGGNWINNNLGTREQQPSTSFIDQDEFEPFVEASAKLEPMLLERMEDLRRMIVSSIRRLDEQLVITEKIVSPSRHEQLSNAICNAAGKVIEFFRPYISTAESIDLSPLKTVYQIPQLADFSSQKQRLYDLIANLLIAVQTVAGPLGDEWADVRGGPLENRVQHVREINVQLDTCVSQVGYSLQLLLESMPRQDTPSESSRSTLSHDRKRQTDVNGFFDQTHARNNSKAFQRQTTNGLDAAAENYSGANAKVKKFFGEVPTAIMPSKDPDEVPAFLRLDHEGEINFDLKANPPQLRGGTLTALVEQLTRHDRLDSPFNNTFLLTYKSFTTAAELFQMLVKRFSIQPPRGISQEDYQCWVDKKQKLIRFRVVNILKSWFDTYWMENNDDASNDLLRRVYKFAQDSVATTNTPGSGPLMTVVEQRLRGQETTSKRLVQTMSTTTPQPIMPKNMKKLKFLDIDVTEFARQLTIIESRLYGKIRPSECLNKTWNKKLAPDEAEPAANVKALILHSNQLTNWVAEMILTQADVKKRVVVIKHFVSVADVSYSAPYNTLIGLLTILEMPPTQQLLNTDINHLGARHCANTSPEQDLGASQRADFYGARLNAKVDGEHQELCRVPRYFAQRQPTVYSILWYVVVVRACFVAH
jgi:son of sevenless-like protein